MSGMKETHYLQSDNMQMFEAWAALFHLEYINVSNTMGQHVFNPALKQNIFF